MKTLFDKIWDAHVVQQVEDGPIQLYIDRLYCHEVTSPQAFQGLRERGLKCFRPDHIYCMPDHNTPTHDQDKPIEDPVSRTQVDTLAKNAEEFGLTHFGMMNPKNGIIHVDCLRRLAYFDAWSCGRRGVRHRDERGRNGTRFAMYPPDPPQDDAHHD